MESAIIIASEHARFLNRIGYHVEAFLGQGYYAIVYIGSRNNDHIEALKLPLSGEQEKNRFLSSGVWVDTKRKLEHVAREYIALERLCDSSFIPQLNGVYCSKDLSPREVLKQRKKNHR